MGAAESSRGIYHVLTCRRKRCQPLRSPALPSWWVWGVLRSGTGAQDGRFVVPVLQQVCCQVILRFAEVGELSHTI